MLVVMAELAAVPTWVAAEHQQVADLHHMAYSLVTKVGSVHAQGQLAAVSWVTGLRPAPMTQRAEAATWELARGESWVALCITAHGVEPAATDWVQLGVESRPWAAGDEDFAHGAWRTLAWLLGVRPDPPLDLPKRDDEGRLLPGEQRYATRPNPDSSTWREGERQRLDRNRAEAQRWYAHVRAQIDAQRSAPTTG